MHSCIAIALYLLYIPNYLRFVYVLLHMSVYIYIDLSHFIFVVGPVTEVTKKSLLTK